MKKLLYILIFFTFISSCNTYDKYKPPTWFISQPSYCGVGAARIIDSIGEAREKAVMRAHLDLALQLSFKMDVISPKSEAKKLIVTGNISGSTIKKTRIVHEDLYILVCFEMAFDHELTDEQKSVLESRSKKVHQELKKAMENYDK